MRFKATAALLGVCIILFLPGCVGQAASELPLSDRISNCDEVVAAIRHGLRNHAHSITVTFDYSSDIMDELTGVVGDWVEASLEETGSPVEGDYIRYQYGGYEISCSYSVSDGRYSYTVEIVPSYYCYFDQEEEANEVAEAVLQELNLHWWDSDYEKVAAIYDYVCQNVVYDKVHGKNPYSHLKSTAYSALVLKTATCQGYCVTLYRLLRASVINCRIVTGVAYGEGGGELHAWNIVELDGRYYNLDATWDAGRDEYQYFLKGEDGFADHELGEAFLTEAFTAQYPMSQTDYFAG